MESLLTVRDVAAIIRCDYLTALRHVKKGNIKGIKIGGSWRISRSTIDELINRVDTGYSTDNTRIPSGGKRGRPANRSNISV